MRLSTVECHFLEDLLRMKSQFSKIDAWFFLNFYGGFLSGGGESVV
jgi:hypothetical protein